MFETPKEATEKEAEEEITGPAHTRRKKGGRSPLPADLPRVEVVHDVPEEEKICACGCAKHRMGEDVTEKLEMIPAKAFVRRDIRPKYVCRNCSGSIVQAPLPAEPIARCIAGPSFLAHMAVSKYADHSPLCRMERSLSRSGIDITRSNMSEWVMRLHQLCRPLIDRIKRRILESDVISSDDTSIRVQQQSGGTKRSYLWVYLGDEKAPYTLFDFREGRSREGPRAVLGDYKGYLQADAYSGYEELYRLRDESGAPCIIEAGCWAHARRYFFEALDSAPDLAPHVLEEIQRLYEIERLLRETDPSPENRHRVRQEQSVAVLERLKTWLEDNPGLPKSPWGKAVHYSLANWKKLVRYTGDGRIEIDNNLVENAIRPVALGRKNYLFAGSHEAAQRAAVTYSLLATCKKHGVEPQAWLTNVLTRIPTHPHKAVHELLPHIWKTRKV